MGVSRIEITIDELVLDGLPRVDRDVVLAAFTRELTRLLADGPAPVAGTRDTVAGPALPAHRGSRRLGASLARAVHTGLSEVDGPPAASRLHAASRLSEVDGR